MSQPFHLPHLPSPNRTEADKEKLLDEVKHDGLDDLEALAEKVGTKSEQELDFFLGLLHEHLGRQYLQAFINTQPPHQSRAKRNQLMAKLLESVMNGKFEGQTYRLLTNVTATDPDALFAEGAAAGGGGGAGKMGGVGRRRVAAPAPKKGYTKRKREEQAKEEAAKKRAKSKTTAETEEEEKEEEEEETAQEQPEPAALAGAPSAAEQEEGQAVGGVKEEDEEEIVEAGVYEENADDWEPVAAVAAAGPMEETKQNVEEKGQKVE